MASAGFSSGAVFHPQESLPGNLCRPPPKELQYFSQGQGKQNSSASCISNLKISEHVDPWKCREWLEDYDQLSRPGSSFGMPEIIDLQDAHPESGLLSSGISDQCSPHGKILPPLQFASTIPEVEILNRPIIPDLKGFKDIEAEFTWNNDYLQPSLVYPEAEVFIPKPSFEYIDDVPCGTTMRILPDSRMLFMGSEAEINDLVLMLSDIYRSRKSMSLSRRQMVIPYFRRSRNGGQSKMQAQTVTPRPETLKAKPTKSKKESKRSAKERDMYENTFFRACESLLCIIFDGNNREMNFLSLKKSGPEVSHLLMQLSVGITGAAVALLISVLWRVAVFRVPFCATKMLNTGIGLGLVWLSAAVNSLRDNIIMFSRSSRRIGWGDGEIRRVERSLSQISFRALTLMAIAVVRYV